MNTAEYHIDFIFKFIRIQINRSQINDPHRSSLKQYLIHNVSREREPNQSYNN